MTASESYTEFLTEALAPLGDVRVRRMFGGAGLFLDGLMFGLIADDVLFFKVDDVNRPAFEGEGMAPFSYQRKDKPAVAMSYSRAPERLFDEPDALVDWARDAFAAARRAAKPKKKARSAIKAKRKAAPKRPAKKPAAKRR